MPNSEVQGASRPSRRLMLTALALWAVLVLVLPLSALTLNAIKVAGLPLGYWFASQGALIALAALTLVFAARAGGDRSGERFGPSLILAGEAIGATGFIGFAGAIATLGFDGLVYPLGLAAGLALLALLIAPRFALYPVRSIGGFFGARYGGAWPRRLALLITAFASVLLLAADLRGGALAVQCLGGLDYASAVAAVTVAVTMVWLARCFVPPRRPSGILFGVLLICFLAALVAFTVHQGRLPLPQFILGSVLQDLSALDQKLIADKLADWKSLRPMASPFLQVPAVNFAGVLLALSLGVAALPHMLGRHLSQWAVSAGDAPRRAAYATLFAAVFLLGLAAYAVLARFGIETTLASGLETAALPASLLDASGRGWVELCGLKSSIASDVAAACAKASGHRGFLRLQDLNFSSDAFAIAAPSIAGLPAIITIILCAGLLIAALLTGHAILSGVMSAVSEGRVPGAAGPQPFSPPAIALAVIILLTALALAMLGNLQIAELFSDGLAVLASGLFPALVLGLYWRRMTASAAVAAMLTGFALAIVYITGVRLFPALLFDWTGAVSNAAPAAARKFADLEAAVAIAASGDLKAAANAALDAHAGPIANWWGLKPAGIVLIAAPAGFAAAVATVIVTAFRSKSTAETL